MNNEDGSPSDIRKRSRSYPGASLSESVANVRLVSSGLGSGQHKREDVSRAIGSPAVSGASARKIAAMVAFGLLNRTGDGYSVSSLAKSILRPLPDEEPVLLRKAFFNVELYKSVYEAYKADGKFPEALAITLERKFGIADEIGTYAARILLDSARTAGVVDASGSFVSLEDRSTDQENGAPPPPETPPPAVNPTETFPDRIAIELPRPYARFETSRRLTGTEKERLLNWINKVLVSQLEFLVEEIDLGAD